MSLPGPIRRSGSRPRSGARHLHRRPRRQHRLRRRQSGPADRAVGRGLLLPLLSRHGGAQYYRPSRAGYKGGRACEAPDTLQLAALQRALAQFGLPSLALQLPDPHRARARRAIPPHRGDLSAARLHRRHHPRRPVRHAARPRMPADEITSPCQGSVNGADRRIARGAHRGEDAASPTASSTWCCCRSAPTTSISPASSPT